MVIVEPTAAADAGVSVQSGVGDAVGASVGDIVGDAVGDAVGGGQTAFGFTMYTALCSRMHQACC
jgi:hypothetical protein